MTWAAPMRASRRLTASWRARGLGFRRPRCSALSTDEAEQQRAVRELEARRDGAVAREKEALDADVARQLEAFAEQLRAAAGRGGLD